MTNYSIDTDFRIKVSYYLAGVSFVFILGIQYLLSTYVQPRVIPFELSVSLASAITVYYVLHYLFAKYAWRWPLIKHWHKIPDFSGAWSCCIMVRTSQKDFNGNLIYDEIQTDAIIEQHFDKIMLKINSDNLNSELTSAAIEFSSKNEPCLRYSYHSKKRRKDSGRDVYIDGLQVLTKKSDYFVEGSFFSNDKAGGIIQLKNPNH